jgi:DNA primase
LNNGLRGRANDLPDIREVLMHYGAQVREGHGQVNLKCPFHSDTHQSGSANLNNNIYICFACGVQGNSLQIIAQQERVDIREAKSIAERIVGSSTTVIRTNQAQPTLTPICSSALHAEFKEIVYRLSHSKKGLA